MEIPGAMHYAEKLGHLDPNANSTNSLDCEYGKARWLIAVPFFRVQIADFNGVALKRKCALKMLDKVKLMKIKIHGSGIEVLSMDTVNGCKLVFEVKLQ